MPSSIVPQLVRDVKNGGSGFLNEHNITEVSIDGHTVAIVDRDERIWNLVPSIATPVRFWSTTYDYFLQPGENIVLSCSKTCAKASPPIWYHTLSITHFSITRGGKVVSGVHIDDHTTVECEVYGFPSHVDIAGNSEIVKSPRYTEVRLTWYSKMQYINVPHATINHSGIYTCAALLHASPDLCLMTEYTKRSVVVYAPPTITGF